MNFDQIKEFFEIVGLKIEFDEIILKFKDSVIDNNELVSHINNLFEKSISLIDQEVLNYFDYNISQNSVLSGFKLKQSVSVLNPSQLPNQSNISGIYEPYISLDVIAPEEYLGKIIELINTSRGEVTSINNISLNQLKIDSYIPLAEVIVNFYDELKSITKGYASMNYEFKDYCKGDLVKMDILLNSKVIDPLSMIKHKSQVESGGRKICEKLKELIPRQQIEVIIQAAIGSKILARETIKPFRKDVTAHLYGGDISRRKKLLEKQKEGKKRMKSFGSVNVPKEVFVNVLQN